MIRLLSTADLHLKEDEPERLEVLEWICEQAADQQADALLVGGDLFNDKSTGVEAVGEVQTLFDEILPSKTSVVMVAGNHDPNLADLSWEPSVTVLRPYEHVSLEAGSGAVCIHGLPYLSGQSAGALREECDFPEEAVHLLLGHASYFSASHRYLLDQIERQGEENTFLLYEQDLQGCPFERVLLGHWHGYQELGGDPHVTYVGAPVPNSRRETNKKNLLILDVQSGGVSYTTEPVASPPSWFNRHLSRVVVPGFEEEILDGLESSFPQPDLGCELHVHLEGFTEWDLEDLRRDVKRRVDSRKGKYRSVDMSFSVQKSDAFEFPLVHRLLDNLQELDVEETLSAENFVDPNEPDRVYEVAQNMVQNRSRDVEQRAQKMLLKALYEELA